MHNVLPAVKVTGDIVSLAAITTTLLGYLPPVAAFMSILWLGIQIHDRWKHGPVKLRERRNDKRGTQDATNTTL